MLKNGAAMHEDQVGSYDWYRQFVGPVSFVALDQGSQGSKRVLVASEKGVLGSLNWKTGHLEWRQVYEPETGAIDAVLLQRSAFITVSHGGRLIRSWDVTQGTLYWEMATEFKDLTDVVLYPLDVVWKPGGVLVEYVQGKKDLMVVVVGAQIAAFYTNNGIRAWSVAMEAKGVPCTLHLSGSTLHAVWLEQGVGLSVSKLNASTGDLLSEYHIPAPWITTEDDVSCTVSNDGVLACLQRTRGDFYHIRLAEGGEQFVFTMLSSLNVPLPQLEMARLVSPGIEGQLALQVGGYQWVLGVKGEEGVQVLEQSGRAVWSKGALDGGREVVVSVGGRGKELDVVCSGVDGTEMREMKQVVVLEEDKGMPQRIGVHFVSKPDGTIGYRIAVVMEDDSILLIQQNGAVVWVREEALASIAALEYLDLPAGQEAAIERFMESSKNEPNLLKVAISRLQLQIVLIKEFVVDLQQRGVASFIQRQDSTQLLRDRFNTRKLIMAVSSVGKIFGLDSRSGSVVWQKYLHNLKPFLDGSLRLYILRPTNHPLHTPLAVLYAASKSDEVCGGTWRFAFNPLTGAPDSQPECLSYSVVQTSVLPVVDSSHSKVVLELTKDMEVHLYPSSPETHLLISSLPESSVFMYTAHLDTGTLSGLMVDTRDDTLPLSTHPMWSVQFQTENEKLLSVVPKLSTEHVNSPARVIADGKVQHKYLNPHLIAIATESRDPTEVAKSMVSLYLVDSLSGGVVYHTVHKQATSPVHLVHSENWLTYLYNNHKLRRYELAVLELYEPNTTADHTSWSSLAPHATPEVVGQAYGFFPMADVMATTQTLRGITHKGILFGLHSGHIGMVPKDFLDPRRALEPTEEMKEEGIPPYIPQILLGPMNYINYNQTITRVRQIFATATGLESTCLVTACGLDLFHTRVMPSKQFDMLAEDFDYKLIAAVVGGLLLGTILLSLWAKRKTLAMLWK